MSRVITRPGSLIAIMLCAGLLWVGGTSIAAADATPTAKTLGAGNADGVVKLVFMLKRKQGMSREEFLRYY